MFIFCRHQSPVHVSQFSPHICTKITSAQFILRLMQHTLMSLVHYFCIPLALPQVKEKFVESKVPTTREEFFKYSCQLTLDLNTAYKNLLLSKDNKEAVWQDVALPYPDHPERFDYNAVVLCRGALSGRCYWEVEWSGVQVIMGVAYKGINRKNCPRHGNFDWMLKTFMNRPGVLMCLVAVFGRILNNYLFGPLRK
uniref:B30.2/SPRY domain-containing protein n=1 Tax=Hucho hucho TaxID=62062 RepID=A0A4W5LDH4_9TELE